MASATGVPAVYSTDTEQEPLLGRPGDVSQTDEMPLYSNLVMGTGWVAQIGAWLLLAIVWGAVFTHPFISPFSVHPLLNSFGLLMIAQAALILQPTHTPLQKTQGTRLHSFFNVVALSAMIAAFVCIYYNKAAHGGVHFESPHAIMGLTTYILLIIQGVVGVTQYYTPQVYGGVGNARKIWKYHRVSGYAVFVLMLATVCAATSTTYNVNVLDIKLWAVIVASVLTLAGIVPRIKKQKLGL